MREEILKIALKAWWNTLPLDAPERQVYELVKEETKPIVIEEPKEIKKPKAAKKVSKPKKKASKK